jgi:hypothetical protein
MDPGVRGALSETIVMQKRSGKKLVLARESVVKIAETVAYPHLNRAQAGFISHGSGGECTCGPSSCGPCINTT